jgi:transcription elongation factor GreA
MFSIQGETEAMSEQVPMTREAYERLKAEIHRLETVDMPLITEKIAAARSEGDLKENAEYHGQRENQGLLQAKINIMKTKLSRAMIMDTASVPKDQVAFGATVKVKDLGRGIEDEFTLVGAGDEDYDNGRILSTSPVGSGLIGKKVGEVAEITVPRGLIRYEVLAIEFRDL